jgi:hypothetical protein
MNGDHGAPSPSVNEQRTAAGRPKLNRPRRVRITTTVEPSKLLLLRKHAQRVKRSLGQLADEYVHMRFGDGVYEKDSS